MPVLGKIGQENMRVNITWASLSQSHMSALASQRNVHTAPAPARVFIEESIDVKKSQIEIVLSRMDSRTDILFLSLRSLRSQNLINTDHFFDTNKYEKLDRIKHNL